MTFSKDKKIDISVVIAAWNNASGLRECLRSLETQANEAGAEVVAVCNYETEISNLQSEFPFAEYVVLPPETTVPELRSHGIERARGAIVVLTEDFCVFEPEFCRCIIEAHESPRTIIGGAIENSANQTALDWAIYFYDYGKYMPPSQARSTDDLSGLNVSYKKEILEQIRESYQNGFHETFINKELTGRGHDLYLLPTAIVCHRKNYAFQKTVVQFYHQARAFAGRRVADLPFSRRLIFAAAAALILPILLPSRVVLRVISKRRRVKELLMSLPFLIILMSVWAFGEFCGYLKGAGESGRKWR